MRVSRRTRSPCTSSIRSSVGVALDRELDAVADLEAGGPPGLLHGADEVAGQPLGLELRRRRGRRAARSRRRGSKAERRSPVAAAGALEDELVLALEQLDVADDDAAALATQSPAFAAAMTACTCLPIRGPSARAFTGAARLTP